MYTDKLINSRKYFKMVAKSVFPFFGTTLSVYIESLTIIHQFHFLNCEGKETKMLLFQGSFGCYCLPTLFCSSSLFLILADFIKTLQ